MKENQLNILQLFWLFFIKTNKHITFEHAFRYTVLMAFTETKVTSFARSSLKTASRNFPHQLFQQRAFLKSLHVSDNNLS